MKNRWYATPIIALMLASGAAAQNETTVEAAKPEPTLVGRADHQRPVLR